MLVFVHPGAAVREPSFQILAQVSLVRSWTGPLTVLEDASPLPANGPAEMLGAALDMAVAVRERAGLSCRVPSPAGGLAAAVVRLLELVGTRCEFLITGDGSAVAEPARLLEHTGVRVRVHPSAITYDEGAT